MTDRIKNASRTITRSLRRPLAWLALLGLALAAPAQAVTVWVTPSPLPGASLWPDHTYLAGTVVAEELRDLNCRHVDPPTPISGSLGTIQMSVVQESSGTLDFYYRITLNSTAYKITSLNALGYPDTPLDVDWRIDGLGTVNPTSGISSGGQVVFGFGGAEPNTLGVGGSPDSRFMYVRTGAMLPASGSPHQAGIVFLLGKDAVGVPIYCQFDNTYSP